MLCHLMHNIQVMSIGAELQKDLFKCLEMKELNDTEKITSHVLFKFVVSQDTFVQIASSRTYVGTGVRSTHL